MIYTIAKSFHLFAMVVWMAGMIFVPVAVASFGAAGPGRELANAIKRVFSLLCTPAMIAVWVFGLWIASSGGWLSSGWLIAKMAAVLVLSGLHGAMVGQLRRVSEGSSPSAALRFMYLPVLLILLGVIVLAVFRPS